LSESKARGRRALCAGATVAVIAVAGLARPAEPEPKRAVFDRVPLERLAATFATVAPDVRVVGDAEVELTWTRPGALREFELLKTGAWVWNHDARRGRWALSETFEVERDLVRVRIRGGFRSGQRYSFRLWARFAGTGLRSCSRLAEVRRTWISP